MNYEVHYNNSLGTKPINSVVISSFDAALDYVSKRSEYLGNDPSDYTIIPGDLLWGIVPDMFERQWVHPKDNTKNELGDICP